MTLPVNIEVADLRAVLALAEDAKEGLQGDARANAASRIRAVEAALVTAEAAATRSVRPVGAICVPRPGQSLIDHSSHDHVPGAPGA